MFSASMDGSLFIYSIKEATIGTEGSQGNLKHAITLNDREEKKFDEMVNSMVSPELAEIVLIKKNEMEDWKSRLEKLKRDLKTTKKMVKDK